MTKQEIIKDLTELSGLTRKDVGFIIDNFIEIILKTALNDDKVMISGFGSFFKAERKERKIYSPIADKSLDVPAKFVLDFKPSKTIQKMFNQTGA